MFRQKSSKTQSMQDQYSNFMLQWIFSMYLILTIVESIASFAIFSRISFLLELVSSGKQVVILIFWKSEIWMTILKIVKVNFYPSLNVFQKWMECGKRTACQIWAICLGIRLYKRIGRGWTLLASLIQFMRIIYPIGNVHLMNWSRRAL